MAALIRKATQKDRDEVYALYHSLVGIDGCVWDEGYPSLDNVKTDIDNGSLYVIYNDNDKIIGAAAIACDDEQESLGCWNRQIHNPCEIARVGIKKEWQHKGLAKTLVSYLEKEITGLGFDGVHLLAFKENKSAVSLYKSLDYKLAGEAEMYGIGVYLCFEKSVR